MEFIKGREYSERFINGTHVLEIYRLSRLAWEWITAFIFTKDGYGIKTSDGYIVKCKDQ